MNHDSYKAMAQLSKKQMLHLFVFQPSNWVLMTMTQPQMYTINKNDIYICMYMYYTYILYCI